MKRINSDRVERALNDTVIAWQEKLDKPTKATFGSSSCPLCQLFNNITSQNHSRNCKGCPVALHSGDSHCFGTPFADVLRTRGRYRARRTKATKAAFVEAIATELEYLNDIRMETLRNGYHPD